MSQLTLVNEGAFDAVLRRQVNANFTELYAQIAALVGFTGASGITAHAGGGQGSAFQLVANVNRVATVSTIGDSVKLLASVAGLMCVVINDATKAIQVFGVDPDTINDIATATGIQQAGNTAAVYFCPVAGKWYQIGLNNFLGLQVLSANGAVSPNIAATYLVTKAGVALLTLAAPTVTVDDGKIIVISSAGANAHTLTATGLLNTGTVKTDVATFAAFAGAGLTLMAYNGTWNVLASVGITFT